MSIWLEVGLALFVALVILGIWAFLQQQFVEPLAPHRRFSYKLKSLLTGAELSLYETLVRAVGTSYVIVPQAHLHSFIQSIDTGVEKFAAFQHLGKKSVDFLLCDKSLVPLCAIELDDYTHNRPSRRDRDQEVEELFKSLKLPLLRLSSNSISSEDLLKKITEVRGA